MEMNSALRAIGFFAIEDAFASLQERMARMALQAGDAKFPENERFAQFASFIPADSVPPRHPAEILIDIGGTSTKVGVRRLLQGRSEPDWRVLFEDPNDDFNEKGRTGTGLQRFSAAVADRTKKALQAAGIECAGGWGLGIVWSNAMLNRLVPGEGVHGQIVNRQNYTKGEWFNLDSKEGESVSQPFLEAFQRAGLRVTTIVVANDTPFTMKALNGSDAGMVASTGVNATLVSELQGAFVISNAEMGTTCRMPKELLSEGDRLHPGIPCSVIEQQLSGKFLSQIFAGHILALAKAGVAELAPVAGFLQGKGDAAYLHFQTADLSLLTARPEKFVEQHLELGTLSAPTLMALRALAQHLVLRAAKLAGLMAFASIANQLSRKASFTIALDSRLSREMPIFWEEMQQTLKRCMPSAKSATLTLIDRLPVTGGVLSVPMLGAAFALDSLYSKA